MLAGLYICRAIWWGKRQQRLALQRHATTSVYPEKVRESIKVTARYYTNITQSNTPIPFTHSEEAMYKALTQLTSYIRYWL